VAGLEHVEGATHIAPAQLHKRVGGIGKDLDVLFPNDLVHQHPDIGFLERAEPETSAPGQQGGRQLVGVVGNDAESGVDRVLFHDAAESHLRRVGHGIGLVENDELEPRAGGRAARAAGPRGGGDGEDLLGGGKSLDLLADDVDASVV